MAKAYNTPNRSFVVQISSETGGWLGVEKIDQYVDPRKGARGEESIRNQVEKHLWHRTRKTGKCYYVIYEGNPEMAAAILGSEAEIPF